MFNVDLRITSTSFHLGDWPLSRVFLKNNADYPWCILVPRHDLIQSIDELPLSEQLVLIQEIASLSSIMRKQFEPTKINVGALGNIVSQLHVHVVARFETDPLWPHGIWQDNQVTKPYLPTQSRSLLEKLTATIQATSFA